MGIEVFITGRRREAAKARAMQLGAAKLYDPSTDSAHLFVNAAPIGDAPLDKCPNLLEALRGARVCFDHEMPGARLHRFCDEHKIVHVPGTAMYWPQMAAQWSLFLEGIVAEERVPTLLREAEEHIAAG
eukprot:3916582-Prymnesium_polylepis.2